ncbi:MAG: hypothetical protein WAT25_17070 [Paracoccaceae bacterium]
MITGTNPRNGAGSPFQHATVEIGWPAITDPARNRQHEVDPRSVQQFRQRQIVVQLLTQRSLAWVGVMPDEQLVEKVPSLKPPESIRFCVMGAIPAGGLKVFYV